VSDVDALVDVQVVFSDGSTDELSGVCVADAVTSDRLAAWSDGKGTVFLYSLANVRCFIVTPAAQSSDAQPR
jgi:hypothetical protein